MFATGTEAFFAIFTRHLRPNAPSMRHHLQVPHRFDMLGHALIRRNIAGGYQQPEQLFELSSIVAKLHLYFSVLRLCQRDHGYHSLASNSGQAEFVTIAIFARSRDQPSSPQSCHDLIGHGQSHIGKDLVGHAETAPAAVKQHSDEIALGQA